MSNPQTPGYEHIGKCSEQENNLKNIGLIPRNKLVVITGISGSGKSSLAFDTIYAEGQRSLRKVFRPMPEALLAVWNSNVDKITGLSPVARLSKRPLPKTLARP